MTTEEQFDIYKVTRDRFEDVHDLLETHFFPSAPVSRVMKISQKTEFWTWAWVRSCLMEEESHAVLDKSGDMVGVVIGKTIWTTVTLYSIFISCLLCLFLEWSQLVWADDWLHVRGRVGGVGGEDDLEPLLVVQTLPAKLLQEPDQRRVLWDIRQTGVWWGSTDAGHEQSEGNLTI